jgi:hypothetical protein
LKTRKKKKDKRKKKNTKYKIQNTEYKNLYPIPLYLYTAMPLFHPGLSSAWRWEYTSHVGLRFYKQDE